MGSYTERALALHKEGCNCAQAVLCAFSPRFGLDERTAFRISEGFGGGIGGSHDNVCGAAAAIYMLAGLKNSSGAAADGLTKRIHMHGFVPCPKPLRRRMEAIFAESFWS